MPRSVHPRRRSVIRYHTPDGKRCPKSHPKAIRTEELTETFYAKLRGEWISLGTKDEAAAWQRLRRLQSHKPVRSELLPLADHLEHYCEHLAAKGVCPDHVAHVRTRVSSLLTAADLNRWADLDPDEITATLARWRKPGSGKGRRKGEGMSAKTSNHYSSAVRSFAQWLARKVNQPSPLGDLPSANVGVDRRHVRRAIEFDELFRLIDAAEAGPVRRGLSGPDRAMLYLTAAYTGLRASALASLTSDSLTLLGTPPTLVLHAGNDKGKKERVFPIHPDIAERLGAWLKGRKGTLWPGKWAEKRRAASILRSDLAAAGIDYEVKGKVFDFHSLRGQFITSLARAGVSLAAAQKLAGHDSPATTANFYTHLDTADLAREVAKLPSPKGNHKGQPHGKRGKTQGK